MLGLSLGQPGGRAFRILCLGAHADDIEIGCGASILQLLAARRVECRWVVFSGNATRQSEARRSATLFLRRAWKWSLTHHDFRDGYFPSEYAAVKDAFESLKSEFRPDLIFTHYRADRHQDHRVVSDLTWTTFRDHLVLEYEVPKYDGDLGIPNVFVSVPPRVGRQKVRYLHRAFASQRRKHWFTESTFLGLMRLRAIESASAAGLAEAFYGRKVRFAL